MVRLYFPKSDSKLTVESCLKLSVYDLYRKKTLINNYCGTIRWGNRYGSHSTINLSVSMSTKWGFIQLSYKLLSKEGKPIQYSYQVYLTSTLCNYGEYRFWFICPLSVNGKYCGKRVAVLYKPPNSNYFGCRHCHDLTYSDRNVSGWNKKCGNVLAEDELNELGDSIKKPWYKGKATKKYKKYLKQSEKVKFFWKNWLESMKSLREEIATLRYRK